jgi:hypothetical protein
MKGIARLAHLVALSASALAWMPQRHRSVFRETSLRSAPSGVSMSGNLHGQNNCFIPLNQLDQDYIAPRIIQISGAYPGLTREEFFAVSSEPPAEQGQWTYDFSDPDGPQLGTVAIDGTNLVAAWEDPVAIIAEHTSLGITLPAVIKDPVDLIVLVDRAKPTFAERKFLLIDTPGSGLTIGAFPSKVDLPDGAEILGQVEMVQVPWLPSMAATKTGFLEADEYY